ncbi:MAG: hypothetical protein WCJ39_05775 [bacterium]
MMANKKNEPTFHLSYENGYYTIQIDFGKNSTIITEGKTLDELFANVDEAVQCHMGDKINYNIKLQIPTITFSRFQHAICH